MYLILSQAVHLSVGYLVSTIYWLSPREKYVIILIFLKLEEELRKSAKQGHARFQLKCILQESMNPVLDSGHCVVLDVSEAVATHANTACACVSGSIGSAGSACASIGAVEFSGILSSASCLLVT